MRLDHPRCSFASSLDTSSAPEKKNGWPEWRLGSRGALSIKNRLLLGQTVTMCSYIRYRPFKRSIRSSS